MPYAKKKQDEFQIVPKAAPKWSKLKTTGRMIMYEQGISTGDELDEGSTQAPRIIRCGLYARLLTLHMASEVW
jgi:hypothetical protein